MTYEEKLKLAKEALDSGSYDKETIEYIFPELKESEDEKIRKALIEGFKVMKDGSYGECTFSNYNIPVTAIIAWLEKQGKNNMSISKATKQKLEDNLNKALEKETPESWNEFLDEQGEHKPWSEEDEDILNTIINHFKVDIGCTDEDDIVRWLKSLKDRVLPQPKQEWSEEDKGNLLDVKCIIDEVWHNQYVRETIDHSCEELESLWHWLDNIWQRVEYPQSHWKPCDYELEVLRLAAEKDGTCLMGLYEQLKKLREE